MTMKGHTYDHGTGEPCVKCGKVHIKLKTAESRLALSQRMSKRNKGHHWNKGIPKSAESRQKLSISAKSFYNSDAGKKIQRERASKSFAGHNYEHGKGDVCKKCGNIHINPNIGKTLTSEQLKNRKPVVFSPAAIKKFSDTMKKTRATIVFPKHDSLIELILQRQLEALNISFTKQKVFPLANGSTHAVDIFIEPKICIEADGCWYHACVLHDPDGNGGEDRRMHDERITHDLQQQGLIVLRFWSHDIKKRLEWCISQIVEVQRMYATQVL